MLTACGPDLATEDTGAASTEAASSSTSAEPTTGAPDPGSSTSTTDLTTTGATTEEATTEEATTGDAPTPAACIDVDSYEDFPEAPMTCGLPPLCPGDGPLLFEPLGDDGWTTGDIERARCMAAAMRDQTPGTFSFRHYGVNAWEDLRTIEILGGDQVIATHTEYNDFNGSYTERVALIKKPIYFEQCVDGTALEVRKCLIEGVNDVCIETLTCPD